MNQNEFSVDLFRISKSASHIHEGLECMFVITGNIDLEIDGRQFYMNPDDIVVINKNQLHAIRGGSSAIVLILYAEREYLLKECPEITRCFISCNSAGNCAGTSFINEYGFTELKKILIQLKLIEVEKAYGYELNMHSLFLKFIHVMLTNFRANQAMEGMMKPAEAVPELSAVLEYLHQNYYTPISLKSMADLTFMSTHYFSKYFKKRMGESFLNYLQAIRMEHAMRSLLYGNDSILHIAFANGFANPKAFSAVFFKRYHETPSEYRKHYRNVRRYEHYSDIVKSHEKIKVKITDLLCYGQKYDLFHDHKKSAAEPFSINLKCDETRLLRPQANILNIGKIDAALRADFINGIKDKLSLGIKYVYFQLWDKETRIRITADLLSSLWNYHIVKAMDIFYAHGLVPIFNINCDKIRPQPEMNQVKESVVIERLLKSLVMHYPREYSDKWMFELHTGAASPNKAISRYKEMRSAVKMVLPHSLVGIFSLSDDKDESRMQFAQRLSLAVSMDLKPEFISFSVFPNSLKHDYPPDIMYYSMKGYHKNVAMAVRRVCEEVGVGNPPLFMIDWNTVTGKTLPERNSYFRSALILEALTDLNELIDGAGFWLDTVDSYFLSEEDYGTSLALGMCCDMKRPVYFVLEALMRLGGRVFWENNNAVAAYREDRSEWVILTWNPSYLNPLYCTIQNFLDGESRTVCFDMEGWKDGTYQFKKFIMNRDTSSLLSQYSSSGFLDHNDKDTFDYLQMAAGKQMVVFEEKITNGFYAISEDLDMNGFLMLAIKPME